MSTAATESVGIDLQVLANLDAVMKRIIDGTPVDPETSEHLRTFLEDAVPTLAADFDCARARLLDREFPLDDWRLREADLPFEIPYRQGSEELWAFVCVLFCSGVAAVVLEPGGSDSRSAVGQRQGVAAGDGGLAGPGESWRDI